MVKLSDTDWKIMELLWEEEPRTMMDITKALAKANIEVNIE